jgi:DNA-binding response OmpR family regulator
VSADRKKCVLVMDDSLLALELSRDALEAADFAVLVARDRSELRAHLAADRSIDLIILDLQMPDAPEEDVATGLRAESGVRAPILLCSGRDEAALARCVGGGGANGFVSKLAGVEALVAQVQRMLASSAAASATSTEE